MASTQTLPHSKMQLPQLVKGELPLAVPPISPDRALHAAAKDENWTDGNGNFRGTGLSEIVNPYTKLDHLQTLERGGSLFSFSCRHDLSPYEAEMVDSIINLSAFDDEVTENYVPHFDGAKYKDSVEEEVVEEEKTNKKKEKSPTKTDPPPPAVAFSPDSLFGFDILEASTANRNQTQTVHRVEQEEEEPDLPYTFLLARTAYLLVGVDLRGLLGNGAASILSWAEYHEACEPTGTKVWTDYENMEPNNFRITKPIIPYVYDITVQFRVSSLSNNKEVLSRLGRHAGTRVDGGILLERTKRSKPPKEDATKKAKSVLLYTDLGQGVILVTHLTVVLQKGLPDPVERLINYLPNKFQSWGLGETCETAWKTNRYLRELLPAPAQQQGEEDEEEFLDARSSFDDP